MNFFFLSYDRMKIKLLSRSYGLLRSRGEVYKTAFHRWPSFINCPDTRLLHKSVCHAGLKTHTKKTQVGEKKNAQNLKADSHTSVSESSTLHRLAEKLWTFCSKDLKSFFLEDKSLIFYNLHWDFFYYYSYNLAK